MKKELLVVCPDQVRYCSSTLRESWHSQQEWREARGAQTVQPKLQAERVLTLCLESARDQLSANVRISLMPYWAALAMIVSRARKADSL